MDTGISFMIRRLVIFGIKMLLDEINVFVAFVLHFIIIIIIIIIIIML